MPFKSLAKTLVIKKSQKFFRDKSYCPRSSMDRVLASGARSAGSIPAGGMNY